MMSECLMMSDQSGAEREIFVGQEASWGPLSLGPRGRFPSSSAGRRAGPTASQEWSVVLLRDDLTSAVSQPEEV